MKFFQIISSTSYQKFSSDITSIELKLLTPATRDDCLDPREAVVPISLESKSIFSAFSRFGSSKYAISINAKTKTLRRIVI